MPTARRGGRSTNVDATPYCDVEDVIVDDKQAVWIFAEFETAASLKGLVGWLTPENWPRWGPLMFKEMKQVGTRTDVPTPNGKQWRADYLEVVSLAGQTLHTVLRCNFKETASWAAMTYDLDHSVGDVLQVDRGFLLAIDDGTKREVKALKVVGFTNTVNDVFATEVQQIWGNFLVQATTTAAQQVSGDEPGRTVGAVGDDDREIPRSAAGNATAFTQGYTQQWVDCVSDMAKFYGEYTNDVGSRVWSGSYKQADAVEDSSRLFLRVARDWSRLWRAGVQFAGMMADSDVPPTGGPGPMPGPRARSLEYTTIPVPSPKKSGPVAITDMKRIDTDPATIPATAISLRPDTLHPDSDRQRVRLTVDTTSLPPGLYEGGLQVGAGDEELRVPAFFYVSKARPGE